MHDLDAKYAFPLFCQPDKRFLEEGYRPVQSMGIMGCKLSSGDTVADHVSLMASSGVHTVCIPRFF